LLAGDHRENGSRGDLFFLSVPKPVKEKQKPYLKAVGVASLLALVLGVVGIVPLFNACVIILAALVFLGVMSLRQIRKELDLSLLLILVCSLAIGVALNKSGAADLMAGLLIKSGESMGPIAVIFLLFMVTIFLTALITNAAAVSIVFPIAMAMAQQMQMDYTPFFVAIAFAASGDFMTPIGYQTNLMVYGPGGYSFRDFVRVGTPLTLLYIIICIVFISFFYNLV